MEKTVPKPATGRRVGVITSSNKLGIRNDRRQSFHHSGKAPANYPVDCSVPQGSILGPIEFIAYIEDVVDVINHHEVRSHFYADDMQLYRPLSRIFA